MEKPDRPPPPYDPKCEIARTHHQLGCWGCRFAVKDNVGVRGCCTFPRLIQLRSDGSCASRREGRPHEARPTREQLHELMDLHEEGADPGFCFACGAIVEGVEGDAVGCECVECGEHRVRGIEHALLASCPF